MVFLVQVKFDPKVTQMMQKIELKYPSVYYSINKDGLGHLRYGTPEEPDLACLTSL